MENKLDTFSIHPFALDSLIHFYYTSLASIALILSLLSLFKESMYLIIQTVYHRGHLPWSCFAMSDVLYFMQYRTLMAFKSASSHCSLLSDSLLSP